MKNAALLLLLLIGGGLAALRAETPAALAPAAPAEPKSKLSPELSQQLSAVLPKYAPPAPAVVKPAAPDPDVLELPKITVRPKARPRLNLTEEAVMTGKGFNEQLAMKNTSALDRSVLNRFTLPSWTGAKSAAERAREEYERNEREKLTKDVLDLARVTEVVDPAQAKAMRDAISKP